MSNKSFCAECNHFNDETRMCDAEHGKLKGMILSEELTAAHHDCGYFDERIYMLTEAAILQGVLDDNNIMVSIEKAKKIVDEFFESMVKSGYIKKGESK